MERETRGEGKNGGKACEGSSQGSVRQFDDPPAHEAWYRPTATVWLLMSVRL